MYERLSAVSDDDRAVSPVIGVILMVAITVILAAVIGTFVLGLGDSLGDNQPSAQLNVDFDGDETVTISHNGGDALNINDLRVTVEGDDVDDPFDDLESDQFRVGDSVSFNPTETGEISSVESGNQIRIIHEPSNSFLLDRTL